MLHDRQVCTAAVLALGLSATVPVGERAAPTFDSNLCQGVGLTGVFGGLRQVPYTNAGLGVWTIVNEEELAAFMRTPHHYQSFIVQVRCTHGPAGEAVSWHPAQPPLPAFLKQLPVLCMHPFECQPLL